MAENDVTNAPKPPSKAEQAKAEADAKAHDEAMAKPLEGFSDEQLASLNTAGFSTLEQLDLATDDELGAIPGMSDGAIKKFRANQEARGVAAPSNEPPGPTTLVDSGIPISTTVSQPDVRSSNPNLMGTQLSDLEPVEGAYPTKCPNCGGKLIPYLGANAHKEGTAECPQCHTRHGAPRATVRV